jgi:hypothetical protein
LQKKKRWRMAKIVIKLSLLALSCAVFLHCANGALQPEEKPQAAAGSGTSVMAPAIKVTTAANGILGYSLGINDHTITMLTTTGWIVWLDHNGTLAAYYTLYYQNAGCTGNAYRDNYRATYGRTLYYDGTSYYKPSSSPDNAVPLNSVSIASRRSNGVCSNIGTTLDKAIQLTSATVAETGLPDPITGPIVLQAP